MSYNRTAISGDNLRGLRSLPDEHVQLIYCDPPFNSRESWHIDGDGPTFDDRWASAGHPQDLPCGVAELLRVMPDDGTRDYLAMLAVRLAECRRVLLPSGSIYMHVDDRAVHHVRMLMDIIFGASCFVNQLAWRRGGPKMDARRKYSRDADHIMFYARRAGEHKWTNPRMQLTPATIDRQYPHKTADGRRHGVSPINYCRGRRHQVAPREYRGRTGWWTMTDEAMDELHEQGLLYFTDKYIYKIKWLEDTPGMPLGCVIDDIPCTSSHEAVGYPTQKPVALMQRLLAGPTEPGDVVLEPWGGSGSMCVAAEGEGRGWVWMDESADALAVLMRRLGLFWGLVEERRV